VLIALALAAAVAGGNLAVTISSHPVAGKPVKVYATGQVGDSGGWLYIYRNVGRYCGVTVQDERRMGRAAHRLHDPIPITGSFAFRTSFVPRVVGRKEWVCGYLYATTCDAAGKNCGPATGLPPDAGFSRVRVRVKRATQARVRSARARAATR
jgi:hypothetical protein